MTSIQSQPTQTVTLPPKDTTLPPVPRIEVSMAFDHSSARARLVSDTPQGPRAGAIDPVYIELSNVEGGNTYELVNLSRNPAASFDGGDIVELTPTGRDLAGRRASIYLTADQMTKLDLKAGDLYLLRAKDAAGNVSSQVRGELEPDDWATRQVQDVENGSWVTRRGNQFSMLDGENERKNIIARVVNDGRPPVVLEKNLTIETRTFCGSDQLLAKDYLAVTSELTKHFGKDHLGRDEAKTFAADARCSPALKSVLERLADGATFDKLDDAAWANGRDGIVGVPDMQAASADVRVMLVLNKSMEPGATMHLQNQRTGETFRGTVGDDGRCTVVLSNMASGDPLILQPTDHENHAGKELRLTYAPSFSGGKAPVLSPLQGRLGGVIPVAA
jgi:hypothetical protein